MGFSIDFTDGPLTVRKLRDFDGTEAIFHAKKNDRIQARFLPDTKGDRRDFISVGVSEGNSGCTSEAKFFLDIDQAEEMHAALGAALAEERVRCGKPPQIPSDWKCPHCKTPTATVAGQLVTCANGHESN